MNNLMSVLCLGSMLAQHQSMSLIYIVVADGPEHVLHLAVLLEIRLMPF